MASNNETKGGYISRVHTAAGDISDATLELFDLAQAFGVTGNEVMQERLKTLGRVIDAARWEILNAIGENLNHDVAKANQQMGEVLSAVLRNAQDTTN